MLPPLDTYGIRFPHGLLAFRIWFGMVYGV